MTARNAFPDLAERRSRGRTLRSRLSRQDQAAWAPTPDRPDPLSVLQRAVAHRDPALLPYRWGRMAQSAFYFLRGNAAMMAEDLGGRPVTGLATQLCGDAHLLNMGAYAAPNGDLVFDLNDFDEACRGPWEWDLKRLAVSLVLAGMDAGHTRESGVESARACVRAYREAMGGFAELPLLELARVAVGPRHDHAPLGPVFEKAQRDTPERLRDKALEPGPRFQSKGPFLRPLSAGEEAALLAALPDFRASLSAGRRQVLDGYHPVAAGRRVAGCGSLGVLNYLLYLEGNGPGDMLFLEFKAQHGSAWGAHAGEPPRDHEGQAVAEAQQRLQTWTDPFLGWTTLDGAPFLVKQWSDHKASLEVDDLAGDTLLAYAALCGMVLAKGHARAGDPGALAGYLGQSEAADEALAAFADTYATQVLRDWEALRAAIRLGRLAAEDP